MVITALGGPLVVFFSFKVLRKSRFSVDKGVLSWPVGPAPKLRWEAWFEESEAMAGRS
jgi:hypothetical protein